MILDNVWHRNGVISNNTKRSTTNRKNIYGKTAGEVTTQQGKKAESIKIKFSTEDRSDEQIKKNKKQQQTQIESEKMWKKHSMQIEI